MKRPYESGNPVELSRDASNDIASSLWRMARRSGRPREVMSRSVDVVLSPLLCDIDEITVVKNSHLFHISKDVEE